MRGAPIIVAMLLALSPAWAGEGADVAALGPAPVEADAGPTAAANPFGLPPLSALSATRERPLFSASRRPPPVAIVAPAPLPPPPPAAPAPPPEPTHPPFTLAGTLIGPDRGIAWLQDGSQPPHKLREGESEAGWVLRSVGPRSVVFERNGASETLALPKAARASASISDPDADPPPFQGTMPSNYVAPSKSDPTEAPTPPLPVRPRGRGEAR